MSLRIMSPRSPGEPAASPPMGTIAHQAGVACRRMHLSVHYHHDDPSDEGTLDGRPKSSRPKSSRRPAGG